MGRVVEARDQTHQGALPGTGGSDDGHLFPRCDREVDLRQHRSTGLVFERYVPEGDLALQSLDGLRPFSVRHVAPHAHDLGNPLRSDTGLGEQIGGARQTLHRVVEVCDVGKKEDDVPGRELARLHARGPVPHHDCQAYRSQEVYQRHHASLMPHNVQIRLMVTFTSGLEALVLLLFLRQPLHDPDGCKRLLRQ